MNFYLIWFNKKVNIVWKGMWLAIVWEIWRHRNNVVFSRKLLMILKFLLGLILKHEFGLNLDLR